MWLDLTKDKGGGLSTFTEVSTLTVHNFKTIVAMGMTLVHTFLHYWASYTCKEFRACSLPALVWRAAASIDVENCCFMPHFEALLLEPGTMPDLLTLDLAWTTYKPRAKAKDLAFLKLWHWKVPEFCFAWSATYPLSNLVINCGLLSIFLDSHAGGQSLFRFQIRP